MLAASAGGPSAIATVLGGLPADFPSPVLVVCHSSPRSRGLLAEVLQRSTALEVKNAEEGERLRAGIVYIAPPDRHLAVTSHGRCVVSSSDRVNFSRPAADVLFASAAAFGVGTLAVVMTGYLHDGASGASAIRAAGGVVLVQDPQGCEAPGMPAATIANGAAHLALPLPKLAHAIVSLVTVPGARDLFGLRRAG